MGSHETYLVPIDACGKVNGYINHSEALDGEGWKALYLL
jgi:hypothetical protein